MSIFFCEFNNSIIDSATDVHIDMFDPAPNYTGDQVYSEWPGTIAYVDVDPEVINQPDR